ncbi:MAG TPA: serine/threonine-protein kinase [Terracidiphilus sp.]|jgi:serine/threonine-protein kinase
MDSAQWDRIQGLFHEAAELPSSERYAFLRKACDGDEAMMADVLAMLEQDAQGRSLLDRGLPLLAQELLDGDATPLPDFGPYRLKRVLGEGGMGVVYLAERADIGGLVAIKILRDGALSPARVKRFAKEEAALAQLSHALIARIYDAGVLVDGTPWFVMEYVEGVPITEYCHRQELSIEGRLKLFLVVCEAVQFAHGQAIIHRDLKPSNILVKADGTAKLLDFGIAKHLTNVDTPVDQTQTWLRLMTPAYAAPEQMRGEPSSTQADVYSLGVILYELLTGQRPFDLTNMTPIEAEQAIMRREAEPPSLNAKRSSRENSRRPSGKPGKAAWRDLDVLTMTAMHKDRLRRYRSVEALMRDCDHYLNGEPLDARPDSLTYRTGKFVIHHRRALATASAVFAVIVGLVLFFTIRLAKARNAAVAEARRTQRIERFMRNLFDGGDATAGPAGDLRLVTLLDRGVVAADSLKTEPMVQADLYQTLGNIYQKLGKLDRADPLLRSALEMRKSLAGPESASAVDSLVAIALLRLDQGKIGEAETLIREGLAMAKRLPPHDPAVARATFALGRITAESGNFAEGIKILDEAVRLQSAQGEATTDLSDSMNALVIANINIGHFAVAEDLDRRALVLDKQLYGENHPRVGDDLANLGVIEYDVRHFLEAEQYYRQALSIKQAWYGKEHPDTAICMIGVGSALTAQGRYDEAADMLREALAIQERIYGKVHQQIAIGLNMLGSLDKQRHRLNDAARDFQRMADINRAIYGENHFLVGVALENLGEVLFGIGRDAEAERCIRETLRIFAATIAPGHPHNGIAHMVLGDALVRQHRYREAEDHLLTAYEILTKQPTLSPKDIQNVRNDLVAVYEALHQPDKAATFRVDMPAQIGSAQKTAQP